MCEASVVALRPLSQDHSAAYSNIRAVERVAKGDKRGKLAKNYVAGRAMLPVASGEDGSAVQYMRISEGRLGDSTRITGPLSAGDVVPVIDAVDRIRGFHVATGFSGHGFQQSAGVGRGLSELIIYGEYRTLDLADLGHDRIVRGEPFLEKAII